MFLLTGRAFRLGELIAEFVDRFFETCDFAP